MSTAPSQALNNANIGLRCHDVHQGMANVDTRSAYIAEIETTRLVGMAANLAVNIKGQDVLESGDALKKIAAQELGVDGLNFRAVLDLLEEADMVTVRSIAGGRDYKIEENIPLHQSLYDRLGEVWEARHPADLEHETVALVHALAQSPREYEDVQSEIPQADLKPIMAIGEATQLIKALKLSDGTQLLYSPFFVFENPEVMREIFEAHPRDDVVAVMAAIRGEQGRIVDESNPVMKDMVARGLLMAPTISSAGGDAAFAFLPYSVDAQYLGAKKAILDKAIQESSHRAPLDGASQASGGPLSLGRRLLERSAQLSGLLRDHLCPGSRDLQSSTVVRELRGRIDERQAHEDLAAEVENRVVQPMRPRTLPPPRPRWADVIPWLPCHCEPPSAPCTTSELEVVLR